MRVLSRRRATKHARQVVESRRLIVSPAIQFDSIDLRARGFRTRSLCVVFRTPNRIRSENSVPTTPAVIMFPTTFLCCLVCVLLASMSAATAERTSNVMRVADTADSIANRLQFSATTTAAPQHRDADEATDDDTAQSETIDDFEDTIPDGVPADSALSGFESAAAGLGKVVDVFETLSTVWQTVNAQRANGVYNVTTDSMG